MFETKAHWYKVDRALVSMGSRRETARFSSIDLGPNFGMLQPQTFENIVDSRDMSAEPNSRPNA